MSTDYSHRFPRVTYLIYFLSAFLVLQGCKEEKSYTEKAIVNWEEPRNIYAAHLQKALAYLDTLTTIKSSDPRAKELFKNLRISFKQAEPYASYLNPAVGHRANGPALPIFKEDNGKILNPIGLQKIEESIFDGIDSEAQYEEELHILKGLLKNLEKNIEKHALDPKRFFIATHQQLMRIVSLSVSGFDTPVSGWGIEEAALSLNNLF